VETEDYWRFSSLSVGLSSWKFYCSSLDLIANVTEYRTIELEILLLIAGFDCKRNKV
jgi:hypothetical protein